MKPRLQALPLLAGLLFAAGPMRAQVCSGDVVLPTQARVEAFACSAVTGSLILTSGTEDPIVDLSPLEELTTVGLSLEIYDTTGLTSLAGLEGLTSVGSFLRISNNTALARLTGLDSLTSIGGNLQVDDNPGLASLAGLEGLSTIGGHLYITGNAGLTTLAGLTLHFSVHTLYIGQNERLSGGMAGLAASARVLPGLRANPEPTTPSGHQRIPSGNRSFYITRNPSLERLSGLEGLSTISGDLVIWDNTGLSTLDGLAGLTSVGGILHILNRLGSHSPKLAS